MVRWLLLLLQPLPAQQTTVSQNPKHTPAIPLQNRLTPSAKKPRTPSAKSLAPPHHLRKALSPVGGPLVLAPAPTSAGSPSPFARPSQPFSTETISNPLHHPPSQLFSKNSKPFYLLMVRWHLLLLQSLGLVHQSLCKTLSTPLQNLLTPSASFNRQDSHLLVVRWHLLLLQSLPSHRGRQTSS